MDALRNELDLRNARSSTTPNREEAMMANALSDNERTLMDAYWRAANYLSVGQIYLYHFTFT